MTPDDAKPGREWLKQAAEKEDRYPLAGNAKPDPLEELRDCVRYGNTPGEHVLAAWEKERERRNAYTSPCDECGTVMLECCPKCDAQGQATALRAAVEKVRDELRKKSTPGDGYAYPIGPKLAILMADALDAALRGEA